MNEWQEFIIKKHSPLEDRKAPYDGKPFLACIWGNDTAGAWVGMGIYSCHYDAGERCPGKYEFFYVSQNPEEEGWEIKIEENPFPITHWMHLPKSPTSKRNKA